MMTTIKKTYLKQQATKRLQSPQEVAASQRRLITDTPRYLDIEEV